MRRKNDKMKKIMLLLLIIISLSSCSKEEIYFTQNDNQLINTNQTQKLLIDLKGEVVFPNLYQVDSGITIYELVLIAGGFTDNANTDNINLATILEQNQMITIPPKNNLSDSQNRSDLVNINTATLSQLCTLPGIGSAKAKNIIEYRTKNGNFITIDDLKKVSGIGEEIFNQLKAYICV